MKKFAKKLLNEAKSIFCVPLIIRFCSSHQRYEWYDPVNRWGGVATSLSYLREKLAEKYLCKQCWSYHIYYVLLLSPEGERKMHFTDFISSD